mgnify:FL=1|tara:strand:+ start:551 stop:1003 length:453 start_codon:yes stop_codon:yes gene_type:complete
MKKDHTPEYMKQLSGKVLEINFKTQSLRMSFLATKDICHSNGTIIQGGFTTVMMDSCMAFLIMELTDFIYTPMSIDINVSFLAAGHPGALECQSKIVKLGKSIGFAKAELHQDGNLIATASSSLKLVKLEGVQKDFLKDNIAKEAKIIKP